MILIPSYKSVPVHQLLFMQWEVIQPNLKLYTATDFSVLYLKKNVIVCRDCQSYLQIIILYLSLHSNVKFVCYQNNSFPVEIQICSHVVFLNELACAIRGLCISRICIPTLPMKNWNPSYMFRKINSYFFTRKMCHTKCRNNGLHRE